jgi:hypothetical protein
MRPDLAIPRKWTQEGNAKESTIIIVREKSNDQVLMRQFIRPRVAISMCIELEIKDKEMSALKAGNILTRIHR